MQTVSSCSAGFRGDWLPAKHNGYSSTPPPPPTRFQPSDIAPQHSCCPVCSPMGGVAWSVGPLRRHSASNFTPSAVLTTGQFRTEWPSADWPRSVGCSQRTQAEVSDWAQLQCGRHCTSQCAARRSVPTRRPCHSVRPLVQLPRTKFPGKRTERAARALSTRNKRSVRCKRRVQLHHSRTEIVS